MKALTAIFTDSLSSTQALHAADFQSEGLKETGRKPRARKPYWRCPTAMATKFPYSTTEELADDSAARIIELRKIFRLEAD
jgi:hypothetical protein